MSLILIKNGIIGKAEGSFRGDVLVEGEKIVEAKESIECKEAALVDAKGSYVIPGGVDPHTHVSLSSKGRSVSDGFEAATKAAIWGGTTTIVEHPSFAPEGSPLSFAVDDVVKKGFCRSYTDFGVHMVFQGTEKTSDIEIEELIDRGFPTGKVYTTYDARLTDEKIIPLMKKMISYRGLLFYHAENDAVIRELSSDFETKNKTGSEYWPLSRPDYCESEAIKHILALAKTTGAPTYIVHLSTGLGLREIKEARAEGQKVFAETCPQYLCLDEELYTSENGLDFIMAPPLRRKEDREALWDAISSGDIDTVGTDHCSFSREAKLKYGRKNVFESPGGIPGIETRMPILFSEGVHKGRISLERFVAVTSSNPAKILGISDKGRLEPGADADIVIIDSEDERILSKETLHQKVDYTPFDGMRVRGFPSHVWLRGVPMLTEGVFVAEEPSGRFIKRFL
ncbi:MAG: dihydropyrimidinase [Synergistaceae bacterium]|nr:dihydropyrimidinase [Synergistaceae bacterium]